MPKYDLTKQNWTIIFRIELINGQILTFLKESYVLLTCFLYLTAIHFFSELNGSSSTRVYTSLGSSIPSCKESNI